MVPRRDGWQSKGACFVANMDRVRFGEWLVSQSLISRSDLFRALAVAYQRRCRLGDALVAMGLVERQRVELAFATLHGVTATPPPLPTPRSRRRPKGPPQQPPPIPKDARRAPLIPGSRSAESGPNGEVVHLLTRPKKQR